MPEALQIELARVLPVSEVNGPGRRTVIWVQGCRKRCRGCWNPQFLPFGSNWQMTPAHLVDHVSGITDDFSRVEGVTFTGGEPFEQADALAAAAAMFRARGLSVMSYSGYTLAEIVSLGRRSLLEQLDILVDGEYDEQQKVHRLWRSSANQTVHFLTSRYESLRHEAELPMYEMEVVLEGKHVVMTGFPDSPL